MNRQSYEGHLRRIVRMTIVRDRGDSPLERRILGAYTTEGHSDASATCPVDERAVDRVVRQFVVRHPNGTAVTQHGDDCTLMPSRLP